MDEDSHGGSYLNNVFRNLFFKCCFYLPSQNIAILFPIDQIGTSQFVEREQCNSYTQ